MNRRVAFVSGHRDIDQQEFSAHYHYQLNTAAARGDVFVVGNAEGADTLAVRYLLDELKLEPSRITIHIYGSHPCEFRTRGVNIRNDRHPSATARDAFMTSCSEYDIAWVRPEEACRLKYGKKYYPGRATGTGNNLVRRVELSQGSHHKYQGSYALDGA